MIAMERTRRLISLLGLFMFFVHASKACCGHSNIAFVRRIEEVLSLVYGRMGHRDKSI